MIEFPEDEEFCVISALNEVSLRLTSGTLVSDDILLDGRLEIRQRFSGKWLEWIPSKPLVNVENSNDSDTIFSTVDMDKSSYHRHRVTFDLRDLLSFTLTPCRDAQGWNRRQVVFMLTDGTTHAPVEFHFLHEPAFMALIQEFLHIRQSVKDTTLHLVTDLDTSRVDQVTKAINEGRHSLLTSHWEQPYDRLMDGLSKVTAFLRTNVVENDDEEELEQLIAEDRGAVSLDSKEENDYVLIHPIIDPQQFGNSNFIEPNVVRSKPLTLSDIGNLLDAQGRFINQDEVMEKIFRGGLDSEARPMMWKYLLNYFDWNKSSTENESRRLTKRELYETMKRQWTSTTEEQRRRNRLLREWISLIGRDVDRTDRMHPYFRSSYENSRKLSNVLTTYVMYNFDLGYVQGMSDLCAPILVVMNDEADTFWCFVSLMNRMEQHFEMNQNFIKLQLSKLYLLMDFVDSEFSNYLDSRDGCHMFFCFRWMLLHLKREFRYPELQRLWETLWTDLPCPNFHMFVCIAVLKREKQTIMSNRYGVTEILKHLNDIAFHIPLEPVLIDAERLYLRLKYRISVLPEVLRELFKLKEIK